MDSNEPDIRSNHPDLVGATDPHGNKTIPEPGVGGDDDPAPPRTPAREKGRSMEQKSADAADEAGSAFLPHDKVLDKGKP